MRPEIFLVPGVRKDKSGKLERRRFPRRQCRLDAFLALPDDNNVCVENISLGGLFFTDPAKSDLKRFLKLGSSVSLSIDLPQATERVQIKGTLLRIDHPNGSAHAAVQFEDVKGLRFLDEFLQKGISDPFVQYFLMHDIDSDLREHRFLKFSKAKRLFGRIQRCLLDDAYTFQQPIEHLDDATVVIDGKRKIMMSSYSYLGLLKDHRIISSSVEAIRNYGTGASGVRMLTGTTTLHIELEKKIAQLKNTEGAVVYSSGYLTNLAVISTLFDKNDIIFADYLSHQSILDACRLSGAMVMRFKHNDMGDLERLLRAAPLAPKRVIVTDAVFSMDGDIASIPAIVDLARHYGCCVYVDEAHSLGVLGKTGRGINEHFNLPSGAIDIYMGTLSKAIPSSGGYVAGSKELIYYLKHASNPYVFSAALSPSESAAAIKALDILVEEPWRIQRLRENIDYFATGMRKIGFNLMSSETAIIPLLIGEDRKTSLLTKMMNDRNVFVCPVVFPAVPINRSRVRNCIMVSHNKEQLDYVLDAYAEAGKALGIV